MIPAKINPISITTIKETGVEFIANWFDQHKQLFYILGWSYLNNQQQMEELFYQSIIKVHKELPRIKRETSYEMGVASIFIHTCRELSVDKSLLASEESEPRQDLFKALGQMKEHEKEAIVLTYVAGFSQEEVAHLLQVSVEKIKELLFSGIQSLRKEMGFEPTFNGCSEYHKDYIDYFEKTMERSKKIDFEVHIYHCQNCQEDVATFQDVMLTMLNLTDRLEDLDVPSGFMENVKDRLGEKEKHRQQRKKKYKSRGLVLASVLVVIMCIGFFTGAFTNLYYTWTEEDLEIRAYLQQDLGERLDLVTENDGVKIKIKSVIADDIQTLVFYEIENTKDDNQLMMNYPDGVLVENEYEIMSNVATPMYYPPDFESDVNKKEKSVFKGKMSLPPLKMDTGTINLKITKLQKLVRNSTNQTVENTVDKRGKWTIEIPVTKKPSIDYVLNEETEIEGIPVRFDKLTIAPTATILQYGINTVQTEKRRIDVTFDNLEVNNKKLKADIFGRSFVDSQQDMNWYTFQNRFDPIFGEKPKEVNVQFESVHLTVEAPKTIELDTSREYPQTFKYAGSTISIDKVEVGQPTTVVISNHDIENREYERLQLNIVGEDENENSSMSSMEMNNEGVLVDKNGIKYEMGVNPISFDEIEGPRYFITVQSFELHSNNDEEKAIPKRLEIYGYNTTKYLDDVVKISLD
jgi:RNA polymerase sigma factor (sigma-70 family)